MSPPKQAKRGDRFQFQKQSSAYSSAPASGKDTSPATNTSTVPNRTARQKVTCSYSSTPLRLSSPDQSSSTAAERINDLLQTIASVLSAYSDLPTTSQMYVSSLRRFYHRALNLSPDGVSSPVLEKMTPLSSPALTSRGSETSLSQILLAQNESRSPPKGPDKDPPMLSALASPMVDVKNTRRPSLSKIDEDTTTSPKDYFESDHNLSLEEKIDRLEQDWWESEVVAAWYGPQPRPIRPTSPSSRSVSSSSAGREDEGSLPSDHSSAGPSPVNPRSFQVSPVTREGGAADARPTLARKRGSSRVKVTPRGGAKCDGVGTRAERGGFRKYWDGRTESVGMFFRGDAGYVGLHDE
ncbi:hypothetical protein IAU59_003728 [Kwoniella sp. CBS 9459]